MRETIATVIVAALETRALTLTLTIDARESAWIQVFSSGERVGEVLVGPQAVNATFVIPAVGLRRGDNPVQLQCEKATTALPRILRIELSQPAGPP
jgi:hypothetical protein